MCNCDFKAPTKGLRNSGVERMVANSGSNFYYKRMAKYKTVS